MQLKAMDLTQCDTSQMPDKERPDVAVPVAGPAAYEAESQLSAFEQEISTKTFTATVMSSAMQYAFRRENLCGGVCIAGESSLSSLDLGKIEWIRLSQVGLANGFEAVDYAQMTEKLLQFFHLPKRRKLVFFVSSDGASVSVDVGVRDANHESHEDERRSAIAAADNFSRAYWPGLKFVSSTATENGSARMRMDGLVRFTTDNRGRKVYATGLHSITGLPSRLGGQETALGAFSVIDKLASGLAGKRWGYLVVADPIGTDEIERSVFVCREFAGRAESMKQFQAGTSLNETISRSISESWGKSESCSELKKKSSKTGRNLLEAGAAVGLATAGTAALAVACPALIPAVLAGGEMVVGGLLANLGSCVMIGRALRQKDQASKSCGTTYSKSVSDSVSSAKAVNFGETIVNKHADAMSRMLDGQIRRYECAASVGAWETGVYVIGEDDETSRAGADIVKAMVSGGESYAEPVRVIDLKAGKVTFSGDSDPFLAIRQFDNPRITVLQNGQEFLHPLGERYNGMRTVLHSKELARFVNFPLSNVSGIPIKRMVSETGIPDESAGGFDFGKSIFRGNEQFSPYRIALPSLAKHALVCGINGSGKTNTVFGILEALSEKQTPYLVIEPAKQEYVAWAIERNAHLLRECRGNEAKARARQDWINVFIPGKAKWRGTELERLSLNPFDFVWLDKDSEPTVLEHIDRLKTVVNASLPMQEILPVLMEELIYKGYSTRTMPKGLDGQFACWLPTGSEERSPVFDENVRLPSFVQLKRLVPSLLRERSYAADVARNIQAALESRLGSFTRGWRGELLNRELPRRSRSDWDTLFAHPTVINLTALTSDDDKAFFMGLVMMFLYEYRQSLEEISPSGSGLALKHLLVIEEAHRILSRTESLGVGAANPKREMSAMFSNMISEVRAYGQGILIADQVPCRLNEDAVKNTNLKIVHKLVSPDDREAMAKALNLWDDQVRLIGDLEVGEAIVRGDMDREPYLIKVNKNKI